METSQRYIVRELTGWSIGPGCQTPGSQPTTTDVMVLDRWDCCRVVKFYRSKPGRSQESQLAERRRSAKALARKLEQDHRSWLAGRVA